MSSSRQKLGLIKEIYEKGGNIIEYLKKIESGRSKNTDDDILISYDFQAGSYIKFYEKNSDYAIDYGKHIAQELESLGIQSTNSIMEVGVGEATTLLNVMKGLTTDKKPTSAFGFDISWSRIKFARQFLGDHSQSGVTLFTGTLFQMPLADNSVDFVYTSHSLEPNGGREKEAIRELYRVARRYVVLLEPAYELADEKARQRMESHGYVRNLVAVAKELGYAVVKHKLFGKTWNPLNPTGLIVIEKSNSLAHDQQIQESVLSCPVSKAPLQESGDCFYCPESLLVYPKIAGIPCLLPENAIVATHFNQ